MLGSLGFQEIAIILILALLLFGPRRLPEIGRTLGRSIGEFRKATNELKRSLEDEVNATTADDHEASKRSEKKPASGTSS